MAPVYDLFCQECGDEVKDVWCKFDEIEDKKCVKCNGQMESLVGCHSFKLIFNNKTDVCGWSCDNYDSSMYWSEVNAARDRGEDVKAHGE